MALDLGDVGEVFDGGVYATINGKRYRFPAPPADLGLWGRSVAVARAKLGDDPSEEEARRFAAAIGEPPIPEGLTLHEVLLSPEAHAELLADGVDDEMVRHLAQTIYYRIIGGDAMALAFVRGDDEDPKAGNRAERRAAKKATKATPKKAASGSGTTNTAAAGTTRKAASGNATNTRKVSAASAKRTASPGRKS